MASLKSRITRLDRVSTGSGNDLVERWDQESPECRADMALHKKWSEPAKQAEA